METLTIPTKRDRISAGNVCCHKCDRIIPRGDNFTTIRGWDWCQDCRTKHEDFMAWLWVILAVGVALFLFICGIAG